MWVSMCQEDVATRSADASTITVVPVVEAVAPSADPEVWAVVPARTTPARSNRKWSDQVGPGVPLPSTPSSLHVWVIIAIWRMQQRCQ